MLPKWFCHQRVVALDQSTVEIPEDGLHSEVLQINGLALKSYHLSLRALTVCCVASDEECTLYPFWSLKSSGKGLSVVASSLVTMYTDCSKRGEEKRGEL